MNDKNQILLVGDLHAGLRNANPIFERELEYFFNDILFPTIETRKPLAIIFMGDLFDDRRSIHVRTLNLMKGMLERLNSYKIGCFFLIGNHDIHYRNSLKPNSVEPLLRDYSYLKVIDKPTPLKVVNTEMLLVPWICEENEKEIHDEIKQSDAKFLFGHFEINTFEMGVHAESCTFGLTPQMFTHFDRVFSGHFHCFSEKYNISYIDTPYQMTRLDSYLKRITLLDIDTGNREYVFNPRRVFVNIKMDSDTEIKSQVFKNKDELMAAASIETLRDKIITLIVSPDTSESEASKVIRHLEMSGAFDIKVIDPRTLLDSVDIDIDNFSSVNTLSIIKNFIDEIALDDTMDRSFLKALATKIYNESVGSIALGKD